MEYKPTYTKEEVDEIIKWFETNEYEKDLDMGGGVHIRNLDTTLKQLTCIAKAKYDNRNFSGQVFFLFKIREELIKQGKTKEKT